MTVSEFIKTRLKELNMTQNDLANQLGITKQNLNNKLSRDNFSSKELCEIADVLKTEIIMKTEKEEIPIKY
ncbi:MAG: helix-turn-helix transcriptional regulator [Ruminococcus sp.]|nr:helix-turn-helix transcriptional regulator [Ruminococcus sp.]MBR1863843.1 helix-turn-helix transcriptional regulator [Ruminococcus sp.]